MACRYPYWVNDKPVKCGKCANCKNRHVDGWVFRILQEEKTAKSAHFVTMTYKDEALIRTPNNLRTLVKKHTQLFFKKLRKLQEKKGNTNKIKYYICGEYGSQYERPHYHAIILNGDVDLYQKAWTDSKGNDRGTIFVGDKLTNRAVAYTIGYMNKKKIVPKHRRDDREEEFALMSKGMGASYMSTNMIEWHQNDITRAYVTLEGGKKAAMPRYLKEKIYTKEQREIQEELIIPEIRKKHLAQYSDHIKRKGNADEYVKEQADNRRAETENFYNKQKQRE